eukprot:11385450-Karenia_brevis.AAC.1
MYIPTVDDDGPDIRKLAPIRITIPTDGWDVPTCIDNWHREATGASAVLCGPVWKGKTLFVNKDADFDDYGVGSSNELGIIQRDGRYYKFDSIGR